MAKNFEKGLERNKWAIVGGAAGAIGGLILFGASLWVFAIIAALAAIGAFFDMPADPIGTGSTPDEEE